MVSSNGELWKKNRQFFLTNVKDFGFGKKTMEDIIQKVTQKLMNKIETSEYDSIATDKLFNIPAINIVWEIMAGKHNTNWVP